MSVVIRNAVRKVTSGAGTAANVTGQLAFVAIVLILLALAVICGMLVPVAIVTKICGWHNAPSWSNVGWLLICTGIGVCVAAYLKMTGSWENR